MNKKILLFFFSSILSLILLEILIRILLPVYNPSGTFYFLSDKDMPLAPKLFKGKQWEKTGDFKVDIEINKYGFREKKDIFKSTTNEIFIVGDSFGFGYGVEENERFSNLLESMLTTSIFNICIPTDIDGYDKLIKYAKKNHATIQNLIMPICMENDLKFYGRIITKTNTISFSWRKLLFHNLKKKLKLKSAAYNAFRTIVHQNIFLKNQLIKIGIIHEINRIPVVPNSDLLILKSVNRIKKVIKSNQIKKVLIVLIPSRNLWTGKNKKSQDQLHNKFFNNLIKDNISVIDLRYAFEKCNNPLGYHFKHDGHWNKNGHLLAANEIFKYIIKNNFFNANK